MLGENSDGSGTVRVFQVNPKSKKGEALQLSLRDISPFFSLHLPKAAQKLGISTTSLKKACRHVGLRRWPGRRVRGLESTIDGLERAVRGQGPDSGYVKEASVRSELPELQQELRELYHGTPAQITENMRSKIAAKAYRHLYNVKGWRFKYHNPGRHVINAGDEPNLTSGLAPTSAGKNNAGADPAAKSKKQPERKQKLAASTDDGPPANRPTPNAEHQSARPSPRQSIRPSPRRILRSSWRLGFMDITEGLVPEVDDALNVEKSEVPHGIVQARNASNRTPGMEIGEEWTAEEKVAPKLMLRSCARCGKLVLP